MFIRQAAQNMPEITCRSLGICTSCFAYLLSIRALEPGTDKISAFMRASIAAAAQRPVGKRYQAYRTGALCSICRMVTLAWAVIYKARHCARPRTIIGQQINDYFTIMSIEQVQCEDKKVSNIEMATLEKHNSVEVGEFSDISEEDIGTHT